jgi:transcriptional regulator with XRE-family HTH domain
MKPPINTGRKVTAARKLLGMNKAELARALRFQGYRADQTVRRIENGTTKEVPGPMQVALELMIERHINGKD